MTHLALTNTVNNRNVEWMEKVTDAQYNAGARPLNTTHALSAKQRSIIPIAAFTATGDQERLRTALAEGLEAGLTVNEIKEMVRSPSLTATPCHGRSATRRVFKRDSSMLQPPKSSACAEDFGG